VVRIAPRYDERILDAVLALDDSGQPLAEISRRIAAHVEQLGITRPSYVHLRRLILAAREREDERRRRNKELLQIAADVYTDATLGKLVDAYEVAERVREAGTQR
jgi:hypothetical protein